MPRFSDLTVRTKLYGLIPATVLTVGTALAIGLYVSSEYRVGGPVHREIARYHAFLGDAQPATLVVTRPIILLQQIETEIDRAEIDRQAARMRELEDEYRDSRNRWLRELPDGDLRALVERDQHAPAEEIFRIARASYLPALTRAASSKDGKEAQAERQRASAVLRNEIMPQFLEQVRVNDKVVKLANSIYATTRAEANGRVAAWNTANLVIALLAVGMLVAMMWGIARSIARTADRLNARMKEVAGGAGDLTARVPVETRDELGQLGESINATLAKIQGIVAKVRESIVQVLATAAEIASTARQQEATVGGLSSSSAEVGAAVREISATGKELTTTMDDVSRKAGHAAALAAGGRTRLSEMEATMQQLVGSTASISGKLSVIREKADNINVVVTTITKVADQTNLLSINAAIEAEKAGEYGRGFLVVAREIRRLADQTAVATLDIENMVRHMQEAVSGGVMQMDKFSEEVRSGVGRVAEINGQTGEIIHEVQGLSDRFAQVNEGVRNQSAGVDQINEAMAVMASNIRQTAAALEEFNRATGHLRDSVHGLNQEVGQFKV
jgi:methyl-accepting chemotaxis protein WspA